MQRKRIKDERTSGSNHAEIEYVANPPVVLPLRGDISGTYRQMTDHVDPDFHKRRDAGEIFNNYMNNLVVEYDYVSGAWTHQFKHSLVGKPADFGWRATYTDSLLSWKAPALELKSPMGELVTPEDVSVMIRVATKEALARTKRPDTQTMVSLLELRETVNLIRSPLRGLRDFVRQYDRRKKSGKSLRGLAADASGQHLEIVFGVMPFLQDIEGTLKALSRDLKADRFTAKGKEVTTTDRSVEVELPSSDLIVQAISYTEEQHEEVQVEAYGLYDWVPTVADYLGLSLREIPSSLYEAIPFSFLVDYVYDIGSFIRGVSAQLDTNYLAEGLVVRRKQRYTRTLTGATLHPDHEWASQSSNVQVAHFSSVVRSPTKLGSIPKTPVLSLDLSLGQAISTFALLTNSLAKQRPVNRRKD